MTQEIVKRSTTPYAGYHYQTLFGVSKLIDWLEAPAAYERVWFECDDKTVSQQGLDDIVIKRSDGLFDYFQVKYTPPLAASGCEITWNWLLKADSGKSFLQKWFDAYTNVPSQSRGNATLVTNRTPSREIEAVLEDGHLRYDLAPAEIKAQLDALLGGSATAKAFLDALVIEHSLAAFNGLDRTVRARLARLSYSEVGIERLLVKAPTWAMFKGVPLVDGSIDLDAVKNVLSLAHPAPMPQDFDVPDGYEPPDTGFHELMFKEISEGIAKHVVLVGPPGRGKSTYISYLCEQLGEARRPLVRHHYFLSVSDQSDRLTPALIGRSLLSQIGVVTSGKHGIAVDPNEPETLRQVLEDCGEAYATESIPFIVVIDGLDHVWRDNARSVRPLDELFNQILPLPDNVILVVGTQPVDDDRLPARLLAHAPRNTRPELPAMTGDAVLGYLRKQVQAGRWLLRFPHKHDEIHGYAAQLHEVTGGHPLHLVYSVEDLLARTNQPSEHDLSHLPGCPDGDIKRYYGELWIKLSYAQRDVLHLMSALRFRWPAQAFAEMSDAQHDALLSLDGVRHLLFDSKAGLQPFHERLVVFIGEQDEHAARVQVLLPRADEWLAANAPVIVRNTWHWIVRADLGDSSLLRGGLTRDWVLDRLTDGYDPQALIRMLARAEEIAFEESAFGEAYRHRMLKSRVIDGPLFQMDDVARLRRAGWALAADAAPTADALASRQQLSSQLLPWLSVALSERGDHQSGSEAFNYAARRWNTERKVGVRRPPREREAELTAICEAAIRSGLVREAGRIARLVDHLQVHSLTKLSGCLAQQNDTTAIVELWDRSTGDAGRRMLEDTACRLGMFNGAKVLAWEELGQFRNGPLAAIVAWLGGVSPGLPASPVHDRFDAGTDYDVMRHDNRQLVRRWFLRSLATSLYAGGEFSWRPALRHSNHENVGDYLDHLTEFAGKVAEVLRSGGTVPFEAAFEHFTDFRDRPFNSYFQKQGRSDFRSGLLLVAIDCHLLSALIGAPRVVTKTSWQGARDTDWLNESSFPELVIEQGLQHFAPEIIDAVLSQRATDAVSIAQETCNVAQELQQLCELALFRGDSARARSLLRQAWDITIGYVHRKDPTLDEVVTALEYLSEADPAATLTILKSIGPQVVYLPEFTDGKGTRHVPGEASKLLAKLSRPALAQFHDEQVRLGDWSNAEISREGILASSSAASSPFTQVLRRIDQAAKIPAEAAWVDDDPAAAPPTSDAKPPAAALLGEGAADGDRFDVTAFGPNEFGRLLEEHERRRQYSGEPLVEWFNFWRGKNKTSTLLRSVVPMVLKMPERALGFNRLLNLVFEACVEQDGASERTFDVAVKVQIDNGGWLHYFEDTQASEARLRKVAELFPARADEFIARSTVNWAINEHMPSELLVPSDKLVFFLARLNRNAEAADLAKHMADSLIADTSGLVLPTPTWAR